MTDRVVDVPRVATAASAGRSATPAGFDVLVLDASTRQGLTTVRSLGRAGLRVALAECFADCDPRLPVPAFRSRWSAHNEVFPSFAVDEAAFADAVVDFVRRYPTRVVLPATDGSIAAITPRRDDLAEMGCRLALPSDAALAVANDKDQTLRVAENLGIAAPRTARIRCVADLPAVEAELGFPFVLKPSRSWSQDARLRLQPIEVIDMAEACQVTAGFLAAGACVLAQEWVAGRREGITLFVESGSVLASFAHLEHRTSPALGGASVVRESVPVPADILAASVDLVTALSLEGLCEVEFRRDSRGRPMLMEINARLAGPIEIGLLAGVDFPVMVWKWATGQPVRPVDGYRTGVRMRWLRGDMRWLRDNHLRVGRPDSVSRGRALWTFLSEFCRTRHYDSLDRHDLAPVLAEIRNIAAALFCGSRTTPSLQRTMSLRRAGRV